MKTKSYGEKGEWQLKPSQRSGDWKVEVLNLLVDVMPLSLSKPTDTATTAAAASHYRHSTLPTTALDPPCWFQDAALLMKVGGIVRSLR